MPTPIRAAIWKPVDSNNSFPAFSVETSLFNHVYYTSVHPNPKTFNLNIEETKLSQFITSIKPLTPPVKTLLSIGGADNDKQVVSKVFSNMASTQQNREVFITSTIKVARTYGFDGVDLDWEFPDSEADMSNLGLLYEQWRNALYQDANNTGKPCLLLTSAVYYAPEVDIDGPLRPYPFDAIKNYVDWVNPICYDYRGPWDQITGVPAAFDDPHSNRNTKYGITSWIEAGVPAHKLVMGLPLYGQSWTLQDPKTNGIGAPVMGKPGKTSYMDIVAFIKTNNAVVHQNEPTMSYYSYWGSRWIGYDGVCSVEAKVHYAKSLGLAGYFFSALGQDTADWTLSGQAFRAWN